MEKLKEKFKKIYILGRHAEKDWRRVLVCFVVLAIALSAWTVFFAIDVKQKTESLSSILSQAKPQVGRTRGDDLRDLVDQYNKKEDVLTKLQSSSNFSSVDPSR